MEISNEYILGLKRYTLAKDDKAFEIPVRRDISEEEILSLLETVLTSYSGTITKSPQSIELALSPDNVKLTHCQSVNVILGVKVSSKQRVVIVHFKYDAQAFKSAMMFLSSSKHVPYVTFLNTTIDQCRVAMESSGIGEDSTISSSANIDPCFVRDLQLSCAMDMLTSLTKMAETMDFHVSTLEKKCAKLMTLLKPSYNRAFGMPKGLSNVPIPPNKKSVLDYELKLSRQSITEPNIETARLLILRAKRSLDHRGKPKGPSGLYTVDTVVQAILEEVGQWIEEESKARTARKTLAVKDRINDLELFRDNLVWKLHTRYTRQYMSDEPVNGLSIVEYTVKLTVDEELFHDKSKSICRVFCDEEPVILDMPVVLQGKKGMLYVSAGHLYFQPSIISASAISPAWFGALPAANHTNYTIAVIPIQSISDLSILSEGDKIIVPNILSTGATSGSALMTVPLQASEYIGIMLNGSSERITISVPPLAGTGYSSSDYDRRLADLISILVKGNFYKKSRSLLALPIQTQETDTSGESRIVAEHQGIDATTPDLMSAVQLVSLPTSLNPFDETIDIPFYKGDLPPVPENNMRHNLSKSDESQEINQNIVPPLISASSDCDLLSFDDSINDTTSKKKSAVANRSAISLEPANSLIENDVNMSLPKSENVNSPSFGKPSLAKNIQAFLAQNQKK